MIYMFKVRNTTWHFLPSFSGLDAINNWVWSLVYLSGNTISYMNHYVNKLLLPFSSTTSIMGFMLLLTIAMQLTSGFFLGWYYIPEPGLVIELREEMFNDTRFGVEVFYMHVRGVDVLFVLSYLHILKKIFIKNYRWLRLFLISYHSVPWYLTECNPLKRPNFDYRSKHFLIYSKFCIQDLLYHIY